MASILRPPPFTTRRASAAPPPPDGIDYYGPAVVGASSIGARALRLSDVLAVELAELEQDDYLAHVRAFVETGRERAGEDWRYADITTVLAAATELLRPASYLEIGVRRGRSMTVVARRAPTCSIIGVDLWEAGYAGMENPGAAHVRAELARVGHRGPLELIAGSSHDVLPRLLAGDDPTFDLITVDGDHTDRGARRDIRDVLPRLRVGGAIVFDDISHPRHPGLRDVWLAELADRRFARWEFDDVGYGVAVAVRRW